MNIFLKVEFKQYIIILILIRRLGVSRTQLRLRIMVSHC